MGVRGLKTFVEQHAEQERTPLAADALRVVPGRSFVLVDGFSFYYQFGRGLDWIRGGQYGPIFQRVQRYLGQFLRLNIGVTVVFDGSVADVKLGEWKQRRESDAKDYRKALADLENGRLPSDRSWSPNGFFGYTLRAALRVHGATVLSSIGDGDREVAALAQCPDCLGVLSQDSDFFIFPVRVFLELKNRVLVGYPPGVVAQLLGLEAAELPLFAVLAGNDSRSNFPGVGGWRQPKESPSEHFHRVAERVRAARPSPSAERLWGSAELQTVLDAALAQYDPTPQLPRDALEDAVYYGRVDADLLELRSGLFCKSASPGVVRPGCPAPHHALRSALDPVLLAVLLADDPDTAAIRVWQCHTFDGVSERTLDRDREAWPALGDLWQLDATARREMVCRLCALPAAAAPALGWGSLGCAVLAAASALALEAMPLEALRRCFVAFLVAAQGARTFSGLDMGAAPSLDAVHHTHVWMAALRRVQLRADLVLDGDHTGQPPRVFFAPWTCLDGPLCCALLDNGELASRLSADAVVRPLLEPGLAFAQAAATGGEDKAAAAALAFEWVHFPTALCEIGAAGGGAGKGKQGGKCNFGSGKGSQAGCGKGSQVGRGKGGKKGSSGGKR